MAFLQHYQVVPTLAEFGDFDSFDGGELDITQTDYTPAGRKAPLKLPGTHSYSDITLTRAFDPVRDPAIIDWFNKYQQGLEGPRALVLKYLSPQGIPIQQTTYPVCKPQKVTPPSGKSGDNTVAEIKITLSIEAVY